MECQICMSDDCRGHKATGRSFGIRLGAGASSLLFTRPPRTAYQLQEGLKEFLMERNLRVDTSVKITIRPSDYGELFSISIRLQEEHRRVFGSFPQCLSFPSLADHLFCICFIDSFISLAINTHTHILHILQFQTHTFVHILQFKSATRHSVNILFSLNLFFT